MNEQVFIQQFIQMPIDMKQEILAYSEYLKFKYKAYQGKEKLIEAPKIIKSFPKAGFMKGTFVMASDFEAPMDDFKDYM
jgi:hypothetical protein